MACCVGVADDILLIAQLYRAFKVVHDGEAAKPPEDDFSSDAVAAITCVALVHPLLMTSEEEISFVSVHMSHAGDGGGCCIRGNAVLSLTSALVLLQKKMHLM